MPDTALIGTWTLIAAAETDAEVDLIGEDSDPEGINDWLNGTDDGLVDEAEPTSGLTLAIAADGSFTERLTGTPDVAWYDEEGVLQDAAEPFDGRMVDTGAGGYLRPDEIASWAIPAEGRHGAAVLRYDDGDTKIADGVARRGDHLVRTVNIVTDELYLTRVVMLYAPADA